MKASAVILAAGSGTRFDASVPKQFYKLAGETVLAHTIKTFANSSEIDEICVVVNREFMDRARDIVRELQFEQRVTLCIGGMTRNESALNGIKALRAITGKVLIHDGARPLLSKRLISDCVTALDRYDAVDTAIPSADTVIRTHDGTVISGIEDRSQLMRGQTPQGFKYDLIKTSYSLAESESNLSFTDDCSLVLHYFPDTNVYIVPGEESNIKITSPIDLFIAERLFQIERTPFEPDISRDTLRNKVVVIFGGKSGIGLELEKALRLSGCSVFAPDRSESGVDIKNFDAIEKYLSHVSDLAGNIHWIINCAGVLDYGQFIEKSIERIEEEISTNLLGSMLVAKSAYSHLLRTSGTLILFASSSHSRGRKNHVVYSSTKSGVVNFGQGLSAEWDAQSKIKVLVICPDRVDTPMRSRAFGHEEKSLLLSPEIVAEKTIDAALSSQSPVIVEIKISQPNPAA